MKEAFEGTTEKVEELDPGVTEALAVVYLALGRAHAILNQGEASIQACQSSMDYAATSRKALLSGTYSSSKQPKAHQRRHLVLFCGGLTRLSAFSLAVHVEKRGRRECDGQGDDRRAESNAVYRQHRLSEIETEARTIVVICQSCVRDGALAARDLTRRLSTRLVYLSGGGTTTKPDGNSDPPTGDWQSPRLVQRDLVNSLYFSFGLSAMATRLGIPIATTPAMALTKKECNRILGAVGLQGGIVNDDGTLSLHRIFSAGIGATTSKKKRKPKAQRIEVELGAGFGDWIVRKATEDPSTNYIAVELRADRVAQILARTTILSLNTPINNLCVVGGESGRVLSKFFSPGSVHTVYVNHPEPPTQTFGMDSDVLLSITNGGEEPAHMLQSTVLIAVATALKQSAECQFIIVTDNKWYARLICATLYKVKKFHPGLFENRDLSNEDARFQEIDVLALEGLDESCTTLVFQGQPNETIGFPSNRAGSGNSYFDRLWRAGGSTHAEVKDRFVFVQRRIER